MNQRTPTRRDRLAQLLYESIDRTGVQPSGHLMIRFNKSYMANDLAGMTDTVHLIALELADATEQRVKEMQR